MDELFWLRGIERLTIVTAAIVVVYLGYRLYLLGASSSRTQVDFSSQLMKFAASGTGPGLLFMVFGCAILVCSLIFGGVTSKVSIGKTATQEDVQSAIHVEAPGEAQADARPPAVTAPTVAVPIPNAQRPSSEAAAAGVPAPESPATAAAAGAREQRHPRWEDSAARRVARELSATTGTVEEQNMRRIPPSSR